MHRIKITRDKVASVAPVAPNAVLPSPATISERTSVLSGRSTSNLKASSLALPSPPSLREVEAASSSSATSSPEKRVSSDSESPVSRYESEFARGLRQELSKRLAESTACDRDHYDDINVDEAEVEVSDEDDDAIDDDGGARLDARQTNDAVRLLEELHDLEESSAESEEAWRRENAVLRDQLAAARAREVAQSEQLQRCKDQLAASKQEVVRLQHALAASHTNARQSSVVGEAVQSHDTAAAATMSMRERALLQFIIELVGKDAVRALLIAHPHATPASLQHELLQLHRQQQLVCESRPSPRRVLSASSNDMHASSPRRSSSSSHRTTPTSSHRQPRPHALTQSASSSSPALDAIFEKYWRDDL